MSSRVAKKSGEAGAMSLPAALRLEEDGASPLPHGPPPAAMSTSGDHGRGNPTPQLVALESGEDERRSSSPPRIALTSDIRASTGEGRSEGALPARGMRRGGLGIAGTRAAW
ncbi:hypothetical protein QYE76_027252 [Lolium multiflorum]|uniref:Uncharacterized protein n=1 Tax=Lolium multiflorum TaxID=4521 RepID=A0AAD8V756_LOLMU|nr:hypothetical protein QYE76_027252 [Lolium multiflorum]